MKLDDFVNPPRPTDKVVWLVGGCVAAFLAGTAVYSLVEDDDLVTGIAFGFWAVLVLIILVRDWKRVNRGD